MRKYVCVRFLCIHHPVLKYPYTIYAPTNAVLHLAQGFVAPQDLNDILMYIKHAWYSRYSNRYKGICMELWYNLNISVFLFSDSIDHCQINILCKRRIVNYVNLLQHFLSGAPLAVYMVFTPTGRKLLGDDQLTIWYWVLLAWCISLRRSTNLCSVTKWQRINSS